MSLRDKWNKIKHKAERTIGSGFFGHANLGPLLDKAEKAEKDYDKLPGTTDHAVISQAKTKARTAWRAAEGAMAIYLHNLGLAKHANRHDALVYAALDQAETDLTMLIGVPIRNHLRQFA